MSKKIGDALLLRWRIGMCQVPVGYCRLIVGDGGRDQMMVEAGCLAGSGYGDHFEEIEEFVRVVD